VKTKNDMLNTDTVT